MLNEILTDKQGLQVIQAYAKKYRAGIGADDILKALRFPGTPPLASIAANLSHNAGKKMRLRSSSTGKFDLPVDLRKAAISTLAAMAAMGIATEEFSGKPKECVTLKGPIPSSPLFFEGVLTVDITAHGETSEVCGSIVIPGQVVDWGAGSRVLKRLQEHTESAMKSLTASRK
jgi:hypothetical protein